MVEIITIVIYLSIYVGLVATTFYILSFWNYRKKEKKFFPENMLPSVSILIPAYNEEDSIARTIKSILKTDYPKGKFEVLVINNNSKDRTYEIAKEYESNILKVYNQPRQGKGVALNLGLSKAKGEIIFTMDADTFVKPQSVKRMVHYFAEEDVMAVTPAMLISKPKTVWQRLQHMEYYLGVFLRKAFASINAIYVTPGAFSAYRKKFFDKYGGFDEKNITEDLEISLRIQYKGYIIENAEDAVAYTVVPDKFKSLLIQRRRWYYGQIKNILRYRKLLSREYGDLGAFVIPVGLLSMFFAVFVAAYFFIDAFFKLINEIVFLKNVGFDITGSFNINTYILERLFFLLFTNQIFLFVFVFVFIMKFYISWTRKRVGKASGIIFGLGLFFTMFAVLFSFWWIVSIFYSLFNRDIKWR